MVGIVRADVGDERGVVLDLLIVGCFHCLFPFGKDGVELLDGFVPLFGVEVVKGFVVVPVELRVWVGP